MNKMSHNTVSELPPIDIAGEELSRLQVLVNSSMGRFPDVSEYLARELERARVIQDDREMQSVVRMGSTVSYRDEKTGEIREVVLVYPHEADISIRRISVLTPVGAALIGLSVGRVIEFQTPDQESRKLTVLQVSQREQA
ncbi:nucleoside diphosphate kinase regulator [Bradyrhizobium sp. SYSU BS000235]|uniref:nucleoside diphosphate kinase regulator n=1 Tax=Bradyrhizobium sp. SYSU BS000235 TaxID=3411332 RepID=UPI003C708674